MIEATRHAPVRESAEQRQAQLRARIGRQREALHQNWRRIEPTLARIDTTVARLRRLREHPITLALLAVTGTAVLVSRRGRRLLGGARLGLRLAARGATALSLWAALRRISTPRARPPARFK